MSNIPMVLLTHIWEHAVIKIDSY